MYTDYDEVIERLSIQALWDFPGGVHPPEQKKLSNTTQIESSTVPETLYVPIKQHIGTQGQLLVSQGDYVLKGQALTSVDNPFSVPVHAPSSGHIEDITNHVSAHPSGLPESTIIIKTDGLDKWIALNAQKDYAKLSSADIVSAISAAGISGMGGAGFPTHIKANDPHQIEFLIVNGVECEPYISSDDRLMREHAWQIRQGIDILVHLLNPKQVLVAIEDNKPEAIETLSVACQQKNRYQVVSIPTKYPAGGEKQLIQVLTSREVPANGLPSDVGCMMFNVGTCFAIADAIMEGKPLIERVVTLTGDAFNAPKNVWALLGTPVKHLLERGHYQTDKQKQARIIMGGPMMGFTVSSAQAPIVKITNCLLAPADAELPSPEDERACIRCSACSDACPASLLPQQLFWYSKAKDYETAENYDLFDCIECGACAYVCPSEIPLVHYYRKAKADIRLQQEEKQKAEKARVRFEARQDRLLKEKEAREEKHRKAAEARKQSMKADGGAAKDKIAAALARAKAKKAAKQTANADQELDNNKSDNVATLNDNVTPQKDIEESQVNNAATQNNSPPNDSGKNDAAAAKKAKVAAAIARAKAKKAKAAKAAEALREGSLARSKSDNTDNESPQDPTSESVQIKDDKISDSSEKSKP